MNRLGKITRIEELAKTAREAKPIFEKNGTLYYMPEDYAAIKEFETYGGNMEALEVNARQLQIDVERNTYYSTGGDIKAVPMEAFKNAYKVTTEGRGEKKETILHVVFDPVAIIFQESGDIPLELITAYRFVRVGKDLNFLGVERVKADEFINDYRNKLSVEAVMDLLPALSEANKVGETIEDKLPI